MRVLFICFFLFITVLMLRTFWTLSHTLTPDFSVYYQAAKNITISSSVYTNKHVFTLFAYPLLSGLFFIPFTLLPYPVAQTAFLLINFMSLFGISIIIPYILENKRDLLLSMFIFSLSYLSFPTKFTLGMGQINLVAYFFLLVSFFVLQRKKTLLTALFFAMACVLKPILGFMLFFFVLKKYWKPIGYMAGFFVLIFFVSLFIDHHALADYVYYVFKVVPEISKPLGKGIYYNQGVMSFIFRTVSFAQLRVPLSYLAMLGITLGGFYVAMKNSKNAIFQFAVLLSMLPILDTMSWQHHFVLLIFPFTYAARSFFQKKSWYRLVLLFVAYVLVSWNFANPNIFMHFPQVFLLSNTFYGGFLLFLLLLLLLAVQ